MESRDHLFFDCAFSFDLWSRVSTRCSLAPIRSWNQTVAQMESLRGNKSARMLPLLAWQATIYWLWNERNGRLHATSHRPITVLFSAIDHQIRNKIQSFREGNPLLSSSMMQRWFTTA
ncbi:BnaA07g04250D [Brassica napus]|uniref:BnaA07g04250D protein n=1 Tax=Brassica napus TaxID=3708 RepID=A0A078HFQ1_BRANA|nr:BnaA07g04250D [Brassica napus]